MMWKTEKERMKKKGRGSVNEVVNLRCTLFDFMP